MRQQDSQWVCAHCGAVIDVPEGAQPTVTIHAASGQPNVRVLMLDGKRIHRCEIKRPT
jgi:hypothetical protein